MKKIGIVLLILISLTGTLLGCGKQDVNIPEADYFIKEYIPAYMGTLDASGE